MQRLRLHAYWRSSAAYRVRLGLALKGLDYEYVAVDLARSDGGQQFDPQYVRLNPQSRVPTLEVDGAALTQSMAQSQAAHGQLQALFHQAQGDHQTAMREAESRHTSNERRWLAELDRARQEARKAEQALQAQAQDFAKARQAWTDRLKDAEQGAQTADARVLSLEEQLAQAQAMVVSQRQTLDEQAVALVARSFTDSAQKTAMKTTWTRSSISGNALASRLGRRGTTAKKC